MKERMFVEESIKQYEIEENIRKQFSDVKIGDIDIQRNPLGTRVIIHTLTPGVIIGRKGENIEKISKQLTEKFNIKNPQIDVQKIKDPNLDANVVAQKIADSIEKGSNIKKVCSFFVSKIMNSGALGVEINVSGKLSGERGRKERFQDGYIKKTGDIAVTHVVRGFAKAIPKLGMCGVSVAIMVKAPEKVLHLPEEEPKEKKETEEKKSPEKVDKKEDAKKLEETEKDVKKKEVTKKGSDEKDTEKKSKKKEDDTKKESTNKEKQTSKEDASEKKEATDKE